MLYSLDVEFGEAGAMIEAEDADLVRQIAAAPAGQARDAEAELCRRFVPRIRLYGLRHLRDDQAAADLAQQVVLTALEVLRAGRLRQPEKLASFMLGTSRTIAVDLRRNAQRRQRLLEQFGSGLAVTDSAPSYFVDTDRLAACMDRLPERERSVVVMSFYDEQTAVEVASFVGVSTANVRVIRHRALKRLRDCLSGGPS